MTPIAPKTVSATFFVFKTGMGSVWKKKKKKKKKKKMRNEEYNSNMKQKFSCLTQCPGQRPMRHKTVQVSFSPLQLSIRRMIARATSFDCEAQDAQVDLRYEMPSLKHKN
jgi:hypothetical protein